MTRSKGYRRLVRRVWPSYSAETAVRNLLGDPKRLAAAAAPVLRDAEVDALVRQSTNRIENERWTTSDVALLDEAHWQLTGLPRQAAVLLIDEVQDLTPMQLRSVGRRVGFETTVLGDLAQACGPVPPSSWKTLMGHMGATEFASQELRLSYRVPSQVLDAAAPLLSGIGVDFRAPTPVYLGFDRPIAIQSAEDDRETTIAQLIEELDGTGTTALVVPDRLHSIMADKLKQSDVVFRTTETAHDHLGSLLLLRAIETKGLEFTNVIILEPEELIRQSNAGARLLFVAMTRCLERLRLIYSLDLPAALRSLSPQSGEVPSDVPENTGRVTDGPDFYHFVKQNVERLSGNDVRLISAMLLRLLESDTDR